MSNLPASRANASHTASSSAPASASSASPASSTSDSNESNTKKWLIGGVIVVLLGAGLWGWGFAQGRAALNAQRADYEHRLTDSKSQLGKAQSALESAQYRGRLLEARALLLRAAVDLERRNFGTANTRVHAAATLLQSAPAITSTSGDATALQREVSATNVVVATDVDEQRTQILNFAERLNTLTPES